MQKKNKLLMLSVVGLLLFMLVILANTHLDLYMARLPFDVKIQRFYGEYTLWCKALYMLIPILTALFIIIPIVCFFLLPKLRKVSIMVLVSLAIGPGLIVNIIFKDYWGRPRPYQVIRDHEPFSYYWQPHWGEFSDNSFPSGHASIGFFCGIPLVAMRRRKVGYILSMCAGGLVGAVRILQGGHFLSDVIWAGIIVLAVAEFSIYCVDFFYRKYGRSE